MQYWVINEPVDSPTTSDPFHKQPHDPLQNTKIFIMDALGNNTQQCERLMEYISWPFHELFCSMSQVQKPEEAEQSSLPQQCSPGT